MSSSVSTGQTVPISPTGANLAICLAFLPCPATCHPPPAWSRPLFRPLSRAARLPAGDCAAAAALPGTLTVALHLLVDRALRPLHSPARGLRAPPAAAPSSFAGRELRSGGSRSDPAAAAPPCSPAASSGGRRASLLPGQELRWPHAPPAARASLLPVLSFAGRYASLLACHELRRPQAPPCSLAASSFARRRTACARWP
ncbi:hypothetical protein PVAP13_8NG229201 [Panicum virgatum]|uniref:Uncharacterized protein n=1 Tax=Panicum virgatum TaxID=38727 RepID=A0A8T0PAI6_PANVG|nr:hypothetical protein PVAP13_8NG229201 [Panicum virgatum]